MTNREKLLEELGKLNSTQFYQIMSDNLLVTIMEDHQCLTCETLYGSVCPIMSDERATCRLPTEGWLDLPCTVERLITEGYDHGA